MSPQFSSVSPTKKKIRSKVAKFIGKMRNVLKRMKNRLSNFFSSSYSQMVKIVWKMSFFVPKDAQCSETYEFFFPISCDFEIWSILYSTMVNSESVRIERFLRTWFRNANQWREPVAWGGFNPKVSGAWGRSGGGSPP